MTAEIQRVGVIGAGQMGTGIAEVSARGGADVLVCEVVPEALEAGRTRIEASIARAVERGRVDAADAEGALARLTYSTELGDLADRELVVEAIIENEAAKTSLFAQLGEIVSDPDAILGSNTSSIPIMKIGVASGRPSQVVGLHFFNPVPVLRLVEVIPSLLTDPDVVDRVERFVVDRLDKRVIHARDRAGFVVNGLLIPYLLSAIRMLEAGVATAEDIDTGMVEGCSHPMGPLALCDLIGLDTVKFAAESLYEELGDPGCVPPALLSRMVEAGLVGRKHGRGFFDYRR